MATNPPENIILDGHLLTQLQEDVKDLFHVIHVETPRKAPQGTIYFIGSLLLEDSEAAFDLIAERWHAHDYTPMLRHHQGQIALIANPGVVSPKPSNPWINLVLAIVTVISVIITARILFQCQSEAETLTGVLGDCFPITPADWLAGLPMMATLMTILLAHEFGHYFAAKYHKVAVTLPYFIPLPIISPVGTLGAFIQLRSPFKTKRQLFDIGAAGPLGGLIFAIPLIILGVSASNVNEVSRPSTLEGNSIFYLGVKYLVHGELLPSFDEYSDLPFLQEGILLLGGIVPEGNGTDILIDSVAFAAWFGLFVTAMNLLPVGQLDGGHIIYCLLGEKSKTLGLVLIGIMVLAGIFLWPGWAVWALLVFFVIGPNHPPPLNDLVPLDPVRKVVAYLMILLFVVMFMPNPLQAIF